MFNKQTSQDDQNWVAYAQNLEIALMKLQEQMTQLQRLMETYRSEASRNLDELRKVAQTICDNEFTIEQLGGRNKILSFSAFELAQFIIDNWKKQRKVAIDLIVDLQNSLKQKEQDASDLERQIEQMLLRQRELQQEMSRIHAAPMPTSTGDWEREKQFLEQQHEREKRLMEQDRAQEKHQLEQDWQRKEQQYLQEMERLKQAQRSAPVPSVKPTPPVPSQGSQAPIPPPVQPNTPANAQQNAPANAQQNTPANAQQHAKPNAPQPQAKPHTPPSAAPVPPPIVPSTKPHHTPPSKPSVAATHGQGDRPKEPHQPNPKHNPSPAPPVKSQDGPAGAKQAEATPRPKDSSQANRTNESHTPQQNPPRQPNVQQPKTDAPKPQPPKREDNNPIKERTQRDESSPIKESKPLEPTAPKPHMSKPTDPVANKPIASDQGSAASSEPAGRIGNAYAPSQRLSELAEDSGPKTFVSLYTDVEEKLQELHWAIIHAIGSRGFSESRDIEKFLSHMEGLNDTKFHHAFNTLKTVNILADDKVNTGVRWFYAMHLTDLGLQLYHKKYRANAVICEKHLLRRDHDNWDHGYVIKDTSMLLDQFGYVNISYDRKTNTLPCTNGKTWIPDLICYDSLSNKSVYVEVELGNHTQEDFNEKMDKARMITNELRVVCNDKSAQERIIQQFSKWKLEKHKSGAAVKNFSVYITTTKKLSEKDWGQHYPS